jgi:hypothetical protein
LEKLSAARRAWWANISPEEKEKRIAKSVNAKKAKKNASQVKS